MAVLGVNGTTNGLWLAVVSDDGEVLDAQNNIAPADNTPLAVQINNAVAEAARLFDTHGISVVAILDAEPAGRHQPSFAQLVPRISLEAAVLFAAHRADIRSARRSRAWVRARLDLPKKGSLADHAAAVIEAHPPHWAGKRDLAALVALAELAS